MNIIHSLQKALDYMEDHLLEPITYEDVAKHVYMSNYHFHRTFSMIVGLTANEYIRNRRLSLAGQELTLSNKKVIDLAYKYGYETPESFTKAFVRFHGTTPNLVKRSGNNLKLYNRLLIKMIVEGGTVMNYRIKEREPFKLLAKVMAFPNDIVSDEGNTDIPDYWKACSSDGTFDVLKSHTKNHDVYGVCAPLSEESTHFNYGIGMKYEGGHVPTGFEVWDVKPTLWAIFKCEGDSPDCIGDTWSRIFSEFLPSSGYTMLDDTDFELYSKEHDDSCFCEVWIPVKKNVSKDD